MTSGAAHARPDAVSTGGGRVAWVIFQREMLRFARQPARVAAALGTPLLIWLLFASGFARSFAPESGTESSYSVFLLPGMMTLVVLFTSIFSSISVIEDRREGWLQAVLVAPAPRWAIAFGKVGGGAFVAWVQAAVLLALAPILGAWPGLGGAALTLGLLLLTAVALSSVGVAFAWRCESTQGFHAVMNLVLMPMWLLSGAFFAPGGAAPWLAAAIHVNPLTWCTNALRDAMSGTVDAIWIVLTAIFCGVAFGIATWIVAKVSIRR